MRDACVLVTGGAGFIGSHLCEALVGRGVRTRVLDDFSTGNAANLARIWRDLEIIEGSLESASAVARAAEGATAVVHLAARSSVAESLEMQEAYERGEVPLTDVVLAMQKSSLAFEATLQMRNKVLKAYEDILNMPV